MRVKCIKADFATGLTKGKVYIVADISTIEAGDTFISVVDDTGKEQMYVASRFEDCAKIKIDKRTIVKDKDRSRVHFTDVLDTDIILAGMRGGDWAIVQKVQYSSDKYVLQVLNSGFNKRNCYYEGYTFPEMMQTIVAHSHEAYTFPDINKALKYYLERVGA